MSLIQQKIFLASMLWFVLNQALHFFSNEICRLLYLHFKHRNVLYAVKDKMPGLIF